MLPPSVTVGAAEVKLNGPPVTVPIDLRDPYQIDLYAKNKEELCVLAVMVKLLPKQGVLLDVGANCGWYPRLVAASLPEATVIALEPAKDAFLFFGSFRPQDFCAYPWLQQMWMARGERLAEVFIDGPLVQCSYQLNLGMLVTLYALWTRCVAH